MKEYDYRTRTRALFAISIGFIRGHDIDLDTEYFITLKDFCNEKLIENVIKYVDYVNLVLYLKIENHKINAFENEKTVQDLYDILDDIKTQKDLLDLYNNIKQEDINRISEFSNEYIEYLERMNNVSYPYIPQ